MTEPELANLLDRISDGLEECLDPSLTREEVVDMLKGLALLTCGEEDMTDAETETKIEELSTMTAQPQTLKYRTDCRICGQPFVAAPLDIEIIGKASERLVHFVQKLAEHLQTKHPEAMQLIGLNIQDITGFLIVSVFATQDPALAGKVEGVRHTLQTVTRRNQITDQTIVEKLARLGMSKEEIEKVSPVMRDMRDALTEQGQYAPQSAPRSNLVSL